jgi:hypothetical protein
MGVLIKGLRPRLGKSCSDSSGRAGEKEYDCLFASLRPATAFLNSLRMIVRASGNVDASVCP